MKNMVRLNEIKEKIKSGRNFIKKFPGVAKEHVVKEVEFINNADNLNEQKLRYANRIMFFANNLLMILISIAFITNYINFGTVSGNSMEPTYHDGQKFISIKEKSYNIGDTVIFYPKEDVIFIKRVVAGSGDTVCSKNGRLYVNGVLREEFYTKGITEDFPAVILKEDEYFLMGDNRENSVDSRSFGAISKEKIIGRVVKAW